ncbi:MAG TPA: xanthine dehydrogenase family protein molybdopterin-binding subunit, partial [Firmicutes bacterium]|nr:xanthine dehydrogenase family protein molybdopterin-binding subunit [Bacillota bacterium]
ARPTTPYDRETGACNPHVSYGYISQIAEVAVDPSTGQVEVLRLVSCQDVGREINPRLLRGQVGGGVQMGLGYALMEELILEEGRIQTRNLSQYIVPTVLDVPELESLTVEVPDPTGPYGAKGVGEMTTLPTAPAILNAIRDATGVEMTELPARGERVWRTLQAQQARRAERGRLVQEAAAPEAPGKGEGP